MVIVLYLAIFLKYFSYTVPIFILIKNKLFQHKIDKLLVYLTVSLIASILERFSAIQLGTAVPVFHLFLLIRFYLVIILFNSLIKSPRLSIFISLLALCIFVAESNQMHSWFENNEMLTVFTNISLIILSFLNLNKLLREERNSLFHLSFVVFGSFLFISSSSLILSIYESDIRSEPSLAAFFLVLYYNIIELIQNLVITNSLWKLKEM